MNSSRNEIDTSDTTDHSAKPPMGFTIVALSALHVLCCGLPLLLLSGVSLATVFPTWPAIGGALVILGLVGFAWYLKKGCATCPGSRSCRAQNQQKRNPD